MNKTLTVELVPSSAWNDNLRTRLSVAEWDRLRRAQYVAAGHVCEVCGSRGPHHPVECHEVKHLGFARVRGRYNEALAHLMKVNESIVEAREHANVAFEVHHRRSAHAWTLDLSWLSK